MRDSRGSSRVSRSLTYSANWDHFQHVPFWNALDFIGISGISN